MPKAIPMRWRGKTYPSISALSKECGVGEATLRKRLSTGCSVEEACQPGRRPKPATPVEVAGVVYRSAKEAAETVGLSEQGFRGRLRRGFSPDRLGVGLMPSGRAKPIVVDNVKYPSMESAASTFGIPPKTFRARINRGFSPEEAAGLEGNRTRLTQEERRQITRKEKETGLRYCVTCANFQPPSAFPPKGKTCRPCKRDAWTRTKYGKDLMTLVKRYGAHCGVCGPSVDHPLSNLVVDHDHETGAIRGLLCDSCNKGIGFLGDDAEACERAAAYLRASAT